MTVEMKRARNNAVHYGTKGVLAGLTLVACIAWVRALVHALWNPIEILVALIIVGSCCLFGALVGFSGARD